MFAGKDWFLQFQSCRDQFQIQNDVIDTDVVSFKCPCCKKRVIMIIFSEDSIFHCSNYGFMKVEENIPVLCRECNEEFRTGYIEIIKIVMKLEGLTDVE